MTQQRLLGEPILLDDVGPPRRGRAHPAVGTAPLLLLPATVLLGALLVWPVLRTVHASVTDADTGAFVGLAHFDAALSTADGWAVVGRTLLWALVVPAVVTALGYLLASVSRRLRKGRFIRLILITPIAIPLVVTGVIFRLMYDPNPDRGLAIRLAAGLLGYPAEEVPAPLGPTLVTAALMSAFVWAWVGLAVLLLRAAQDAIPTELADAVRTYGGNRLDVFVEARWRPLMRRTVALVFALVAVGTARTFDLILVMTPGSVRDDAAVLAVRIWETSGRGTSGPGAALGVLWLLAVVVGMFVAAFWVRQPWPAPRRPAEPVNQVAPASPALGPPRPGRLRTLLRLIGTGAVVAWLIPPAVLVATALHDPAEAAARGWWSPQLTLRTFGMVLDSAELREALRFTLTLAIMVAGLVLVVALLAAYPLATLPNRAAQVIGVLLIAAAIVPIQVIAGPVNEVLGAARSTGTTRGLVLVHVALHLPLAVLVLRNAIADLPDQVRRDTVARGWDGLWRLPRHILPAIAAVGVLLFVLVWNDMVVGLLFGGPGATPLGMLLYGGTRQFVGSSATLAASSVIASIPPVLLVVLSRRYLVAGLVPRGDR